MDQGESSRLVRRISKLSAPVAASRRQDVFINTSHLALDPDAKGDFSTIARESAIVGATRNPSRGLALGELERSERSLGTASGYATPTTSAAPPVRLSRVESRGARGSGASSVASRPQLKYTVTLRARLEEEVQRSLESGASAQDTSYDIKASRRLQARLDRLRLLQVTSLGDGNCQFRSVSQQLYQTQERHLELRKLAVAYMRKHKSDFECFLGEEFLDYAMTMSMDRTWGDELTLRALAEALGVHIHIVSSDELGWYQVYEPEGRPPKGPFAGKIVFLAYTAPVHYDALISDPSARGTIEEEAAERRSPGQGQAKPAYGAGTSSPLRATAKPVAHPPSPLGRGGGAGPQAARHSSGTGDEDLSPIPASRRKKLQRLNTAGLSIFKRCLGSGMEGEMGDGAVMPGGSEEAQGRRR